MNMIIFFHKACSDGFCGAYILSKKYSNATFIPTSYGTPLDIELIKGKDVICVDFSYRGKDLEDLINNCKTLVVLDHHVSVEEELKNAKITHLVFDKEKSGAKIAWEYCFPEHKNRPHWIVDYVEDKDLWKFNLPYSKEINTAIESYKREFTTWDILTSYSNLNYWLDFTNIYYPFYALNTKTLSDSSLKRLANEGKALLRFKDNLINNMIENSVDFILDGYSVKAVNTQVFQSEVAGKLAENNEFGVAWFQRGDGKIQYSLRSKNDGLDVSKIAKKFGGGGHVHSAGFEI